MGEEWLHAVDDTFVNPEPIVLEESEVIINDFLSPSKLQELAVTDDLSTVTSLEMVADTRETTLGNFGQYIPNLKQLKLSDSMIPSVRDIGTSLMHLQVLWMSRCGLSDIDGIASMQNLKELYVAFNNISDISPISFLESVEVVDLEGNKIADMEQLDYLAIMSNLSTLTLSGNPICQQYQLQCDKLCSFRELIMEKMPGLQMFNDEHYSSNGDEIRPSTSGSSHSQEDIDIINTAIKEGIIKQHDFTVTHLRDSNGNRTPSPKPDLPVQTTSARLNRPRPATAGAKRSVDNASPDSRRYLQSPQGRPSSSGSENGMLQQDDSSSLTFGDPICGNPILALRNRKKTTLPLMSLLNEDRNPLAIPRPSTSLGLRRWPVKVETDPSLGSVSKKEIDNSDKPIVYQPAYLEDKTSEFSSPSRTSSHGKESPTMPSTSRQLPSPITSSSQPYKTPTPPPRSPQRPQTASDFRAARYRRSLSSSNPPSVNVMSLTAVSSRLRSSEPMRKEIEDLT